MKDLAFLALLLSLCYSTSSACDPQSNNQPQCNQINLNIPIRNFWDPTVYWLCKSSQSIAELIKCPDSLLFDPVKRECVPNKKWIWLKPCSATTCDPESNNEPICDGTNLNKPIRNFWDPTAYWMCSQANAAADLVKCPIDHMFDSEKQLCIPSSMWTWSEPCPNKM
uniref:Chitin-binding type-2 domain-containing protein n=1 Tax=Musca domestica TaxID=7370 RepID=A0A1I8NAE0_MUSDO